MVSVKFTFYLKSGKTFDCVETLSVEQFQQAVSACIHSMTENKEGAMYFSDCCVRMSECAVIDWEVLYESEQKTEKGE